MKQSREAEKFFLKLISKTHGAGKLMTLLEIYIAYKIIAFAYKLLIDWWKIMVTFSIKQNHEKNKI